MKKAFIAVNFGKRKKLHEEILTMKKILKEKDYEPVVFVNDFSFPPNSSDKEMMNTALHEISDSEILIAELSYKAVGVGLEVGYARALNKKIFYVYKDTSEYSKTVGGVSDEIIVYSNINQLERKLKKQLE